MGWTSFHTTQPIAEVLKGELDYQNEQGGAGRILAVATKRNVSYVAYERTRPDGKRYVVGLVILHNRKNGEFCYKDMDECMGPCEHEAPARILDLLSPVDAFAEPGTDSHKWATKWREACREAIGKRASAPGDGATVKFGTPLKFTDGRTHDTFVLRKFGRKVRFYPTTGDGPYIITNWQQRDYEIISG